VTHAERQAALEAIAAEVRTCRNCRLHEGRTQAVPGEGHASTEVLFVGEGPGFNEDRQGRPFVGRAGGLLSELLRAIGWRREDVFITNVVKCRPPDNRDPEPDEIAACAPFLRRQLEVLEPALVVTLGRYSLGRFMPGSRIGQVHGTFREADPASGARDALAFAMYHPAYALRTPAIERETREDIRGVPPALLEARRRRTEPQDAAESVTFTSDEPPVEASAILATGDPVPTPDPVPAADANRADAAVAVPAPDQPAPF